MVAEIKGGWQQWKPKSIVDGLNHAIVELRLSEENTTWASAKGECHHRTLDK